MAKKTTKKVTSKKTATKAKVLNTAEEIESIGTDIGDEKSVRSIEISHEDESPTWLTNLLTILCHSISLTEQAIEGRLVGEMGIALDAKRYIKITIEDK